MMIPKKMLAYVRPDGGVSLATVYREYHPEAGEAAPDEPQVPRTEAEALDIEDAALRTPTADINGGKTAAIPADWVRVANLDPEEVPADRTFRAAMVMDGDGRLAHDMAICVEIHKARLRQQRAPLLNALDVEFMRALEEGDSERCAKIVDEKQALRDVTHHPMIAEAKTPEALKEAIPDILKAS